VVLATLTTDYIIPTHVNPDSYSFYRRKTSPPKELTAFDPSMASLIGCCSSELLFDFSLPFVYLSVVSSFDCIHKQLRSLVGIHFLQSFGFLLRILLMKKFRLQD